MSTQRRTECPRCHARGRTRMPEPPTCTVCDTHPEGPVQTRWTERPAARPPKSVSDKLRAKAGELLELADEIERAK